MKREDRAISVSTYVLVALHLYHHLRVRKPHSFSLSALFEFYCNALHHRHHHHLILSIVEHYVGPPYVWKGAYAWIWNRLGACGACVHASNHQKRGVARERLVPCTARNVLSYRRRRARRGERVSSISPSFSVLPIHVHSPHR